ncbi:MAG: hypothetical protein ACK4TG_05360, partial [Thermaurantiacus sp.]
MMRALALLVAALLAVPAGAQPASEPEAPPYTLPNTHVHRIRAEALGREYELHVALPPGYHANPDRRYPVLFTTDSP